MDPETPRSLGDIEDSEPERRAPGRTAPVKKSLDQFLLEFEERLLNHPGEPATSASAALLGRAEGVWRTPIEGAERLGRRLPRRPPSRATPPPIITSAPAAPPPAAAGTPEIVAMMAPPPLPEPAAPLEPSPEPTPPALPEAETASAPAESGADTAEASAGRRRNRRHRRHRRR